MPVNPGENDAALIARMRGGDGSALTAVYDRYSRVVYSVALRVMQENAAAEDLMQEVFLHLWRNADSFDGSRGSLGAWLAVVTRHRAIDQIRRRKEHVEIDDSTFRSKVRTEDPTEHKILIERVRKEMAAMPPEQRKAVEMAFFEGLTHAEIAKKTGAPLGTVKTRIRAALMTVKKTFEQQA